MQGTECTLLQSDFQITWNPFTHCAVITICSHVSLYLLPFAPPEITCTSLLSISTQTIRNTAFHKICVTLHISKQHTCTALHDTIFSYFFVLLCLNSTLLTPRGSCTSQTPRVLWLCLQTSLHSVKMTKTCLFAFLSQNSHHSIHYENKNKLGMSRVPSTLLLPNVCVLW